MKSYLKRNKHVWIVLGPLVLGWLFNLLMFNLAFTALMMWMVNMAFVLFWFWAGRQFVDVGKNKAYGFLMGNSLWLLTFVLFIWQFLFTDPSSQNMLLAGLSQYYVLLMIGFGAQILVLFTGTADPYAAVLTSYLLMLGVFAAGFTYQRFKKRELSKPPELNP